MSLPVAIDGVSTSALNAGKAAAKVSGGAAKAAAKATEGAAKTVVEKATEKASKEDAGFIPTDATQEDEGKKEEDEEEKEEAAAAVAAKEEQEDDAEAETSPVSEVADGMTSGASKIADEVA